MQFIEKVKLISAHRYCSHGTEAEWKSARGLALIAASEDMNGYQRDMLPDWVQGLPSTLHKLVTQSPSFS